MADKKELENKDTKIDNKENETEKVKKVETPNFTDNQLDNMAKGMKAIFDEMEKVKIRIPIDKQNPKDLIVPVCINGYIFQIERGKMVEVPQTVYDVLEESGYLG